MTHRPKHSQPVAAPRIWIRIVVAAVFGVSTLLIIGFSAGLIFGNPIGVIDNGDGSRLYCGAGLEPLTESGRSDWIPPVFDYRLGESCSDPVPSSALALLKFSTYLDTSSFSITTLGWTYLVLFSLIAASASFFATRMRLSGSLFIIPLLIPLAGSIFAAFLNSTYAEPAGLLGIFAALAGLGVAFSVNHSHPFTRFAGLILALIGGLVAASAKAQYSPVLLVVIAASLFIPVTWGRHKPRWRRHITGVSVAVAALVLAIPTIGGLVSWQQRYYPSVNAYNFVFTLMLVERPELAQKLGFPTEATQSSGMPFQLVTETSPTLEFFESNEPSIVRNSLSYLASNPTLAANLGGIALQVASNIDLAYIAGWPIQNPGSAANWDRISQGQQGSVKESFRWWIDAMPQPWTGTLTVIFGLLIGAYTFLVTSSRRSTFFGRDVCNVSGQAGLAAIMALGLSIAALGDGYFELAKHAWLGAYAFQVTLWSVATWVASATWIWAMAKIRTKRSTQLEGMPALGEMSTVGSRGNG